MLTDLLVAGLMVATTPHPPDFGTAKSPAPTPRGQAVSGVHACQEEARNGARNALLEAHASFAALPPFSLARLGATTGGSSQPVAKDKESPGCKS